MERQQENERESDDDDEGEELARIRFANRARAAL